MKTFDDWKAFLVGQSLDRADHSRILKLYKDQAMHQEIDGGEKHLWRMLRAAREVSDEDAAVVQAFIDA